ncbi:MAG: biotin transporter BioY [Puniceicoccales bacterium]|jgi:biotin transport system substrate-specific component|nr:biotin transporter BioY [Puniceicoccales bacterium]
MDTNGGKLGVVSVKNRALRILLDIILVTFCAFVILTSSKLRVPFYPVPFTMQTIAVVVVSILAGRWRSLASLLLFTALWTPFCATGGYILGFFIVPLIIGNGAVNMPGRNLFIRILLSHLTVLAVGTFVLSFFVGAKTAFVSGFLFFIPSGIFKGIISFALVRTFRRLRRQ